MHSDQSNSQQVTGEHHAPCSYVCKPGKQFGMTREVMPGAVEPLLIDRSGYQRTGVALHRQACAFRHVAISCAGALDSGTPRYNCVWTQLSYAQDWKDAADPPDTDSWMPFLRCRDVAIQPHRRRTDCLQIAEDHDGRRPRTLS